MSHREPERVISLVSLEANWLFLIVGSVLLLGGVPRGSLLILALPAALGCYALWKQNWRPDLLTLTCAGLSLYSAFQVIPLPQGILEYLSPAAAENWSHALGPTSSTHAVGAISLDQGASIAESLKWILYGFSYALAKQIASMRGPKFIFGAIFGLTTCLAFSALMHGLIGTNAVFGLYEPSFQTGRWLVTPLLNVNNLAGVLSVGTFVGLGFLINEQDPIRKLGFGASVALLMGIIVQSGSRAAIISIVGGVFLLLCSGLSPSKNKHQTGSGQAVATIGLIACVGITLALTTTSSALFAELTATDFGKAELVYQVLPLICDFSWTGVGAGAFGGIFSQYSLMPRAIIWEHPENFLLAWMSEWGVPVAMSASAVFLWQARPPRKSWGSFSLNACAHIGLIVLCLQNLADVGFAVPGVMMILFSTMGGLSYARRTLSFTTKYASPARLLLAGILIISSLATITLGTTSSREARKSIHHDLARLGREGADKRQQFDNELMRMMRWFPTDSYLALAGAYAAEMRQQGTGIPWLAETLRRNPNSGDAHLFLAQLIQKQGVTHQALLELRLAMENDPELVARAAKYATDWSSDLDALRTAIPRAPLARGALISMARTAPPQNRLLRIALLKEASQQTSYQGTDVDSLLAEEYLDAEQYLLRPCLKENAGWCLEQAASHIRSIQDRNKTLGSNQLATMRIEARLLRRRGKIQDALRLLEEQCDRTDISCLKLWITTSQELGQLSSNAEPNLLAMQCQGRESCAEAHRWLAGTYQVTNPARALTHYLKAASELPSFAAWQSAYKAAKNSGNQLAMQNALREMLRLSPGNTEVKELLRKIQFDVDSVNAE